MAKSREEQYKELKAKHKAEEIVFFREWGKELYPYQVGDIVQDHYQTVKITQEGTLYSFDTKPNIKFVGVRLTAKGTPYKNNPETATFGSNIKRKLT